MVLAHDLNATKRTQDIKTNQDVLFDALLLSERTLQGLNEAGFYKPSPVQLHGIPMGKCGFDLLLEAKSGTGKTIVFTVIALEKLDLQKGLQAIMLAPTREIASQVRDVIKEVGTLYPDLCVEVVMGGLPLQDDIKKFKIGRKVHIVVGSPGRLRHLIQDGYIDTSAVRLLVLDEADKLIEKAFQADINYIFSSLPNQKQVIMSSATFSDTAKGFISQYVREPQHICPDSTSVLLGIEQKVSLVNTNTNIVKQTYLRYEELIKILTNKDFKQCLIFCNYQARVADVYKLLTRDKWPCEQLYGSQEQTDRLDALKTLQEYKCRILISSDLAARGIDASNVDLVINFEPPYEWQTYLHRIGRAGRYGSYGTAVSIVSVGKEEKKFKEILSIMQGSLNISYFWENKKYDLNCENGEAKVCKELENGHEHKNGETEKKMNGETNIDVKESNGINDSTNGCSEINDLGKNNEIHVTNNGRATDIKENKEINGSTYGAAKANGLNKNNEINVTANVIKKSNEINGYTNQVNDLRKNNEINVTTNSATNKSMFEYLWGQNNNDIKVAIENFNDLAKSFNDSQTINNFDDLLQSLEEHDSSKDDATEKLVKIQINEEEITNCINHLNSRHKNLNQLSKCSKDDEKHVNAIEIKPTTEVKPIVTNGNVIESDETINNLKNILYSIDKNDLGVIKPIANQTVHSDDQGDDILDEDQSEMIRLGLPTSFCTKADKHKGKKHSTEKRPTKYVSHDKIENNHSNIRKHVNSDNTSKKYITDRPETSNLLETNSRQVHINVDNIDYNSEQRMWEDTRKANNEFKHNKKSLNCSPKPPEMFKPQYETRAQNNEKGNKNVNTNKRSEKSKKVNKNKTNEDEYTLWYNALKLQTFQLEQIFYMEEISQIKF